MFSCKIVVKIFVLLNVLCNVKGIRLVSQSLNKTLEHLGPAHSILLKKEESELKLRFFFLLCLKMTFKAN